MERSGQNFNHLVRAGAGGRVAGLVRGDRATVSDLSADLNTLGVPTLGECLCVFTACQELSLF